MRLNDEYEFVKDDGYYEYEKVDENDWDVRPHEGRLEYAYDDDEFLKQVCATIKEVIVRSKNNRYLGKTVVHPDDKTMRVEIDFKEVTSGICELNIFYNRKCIDTLEDWFFEAVYDFTKDELRKNRIDFRDKIYEKNILYSFLWERR